MAGRAMIMPRMPKRVPQTERERRIMAGLRPISLPMTWGVMR